MNPANPFTLPLNADAKAHSAEIDAWLGLDTAQTERRIMTAQSQDQNFWLGLPVQSLLTPYSELHEMLERLTPKPGSSIVDLGAAYGRLAFVVERHWPEVKFLGYEVVAERVAEGRAAFARQGLQRSRLELADLGSPEFRPAAADIYFLYDFGSRRDVSKCLEDLKAVAATRPITVVGRGRLSRDTIEREHPWLGSVVKPEHHGNYSVFRTTS